MIAGKKIKQKIILYWRYILFLGKRAIIQYSYTVNIKPWIVIMSNNEFSIELHSDGAYTFLDPRLREGPMNSVSYVRPSVRPSMFWQLCESSTLLYILFRFIRDKEHKLWYSYTYLYFIGYIVLHVLCSIWWENK